MSTPTTLGTLATPTDKLLVQRAGQTVSLKMGDPILAGDVLHNQDAASVDIELPSQVAGQSNSLLTLAPNGAAQLDSVVENGNQMIQVSQLSAEGVELYSVGEGVQSAMLVTEGAGQFNGLVGAGLLAGGVTGVGATAAVVGGGAGLAVLASSDGEDTAVQASVDTRVDNQDGSSTPVENSDGNGGENGGNTDGGNADGGGTGEDTASGTTGTPLDAVLDPVAGALAGTPLVAVSGPLFDGISTGAEALMSASPAESDSSGADSLLAMLPATPIGSSELPLDSLPIISTLL